MEDNIVIDITLVTGEINLETPSCIVREMAKCMFISVDESLLTDLGYRSDINRTIKNMKIISFKRTDRSNVNNWERLAKFINPDIELGWKMSLLSDAYKTMINKIDCPNSDYVTDNVRVQYPRPEILDVLTPCILYNWCLKLNINLRITSTIQEMKSMVSMMLNISRCKLINMITRDMVLVEKNMLITILTELKNAKRDNTLIGKADIDDIKNTYQIIMSIDQTSIPNRPRTKEEAVVLAAIRYMIDISESENPMIDYESISCGSPITDSYMKRIATINKDAYYLRKTFNPIFPSEFYELKDLQNMAKNEFITYNGNNTKESIYNDLVLDYYTDTFRLSLQHGITTFTTPIFLEELEDYDKKNEIITYGSKNTELTPYLVSELISLFRANKDFSCPDRRGGVFSKESINKLRSIAKSKIPPPIPGVFQGTQYTINNTWKQLVTEIKNVEMYQSSIEANCKKLKEQYNSSSSDDKVIIKSFLEQLRDCGMYMRAWRGIPNPYPVSKSICENSALTDRLTSESIGKFTEMCDKNKNIGTMINNLPLIRFKDLKYNASSDKNQGLTIGQRLAIVSRGTRDNNVYSCIRMSSNYICASAYLYLQTIGENPGFKIEDLRDIQ